MGMRWLRRVPSPENDGVRCYSCGGTFRLGISAGEAFAHHTDPECADFRKLNTTDDAVSFSHRCRISSGGSLLRPSSN